MRTQTGVERKFPGNPLNFVRDRGVPTPNFEKRIPRAKGARGAARADIAALSRADRFFLKIFRMAPRGYGRAILFALIAVLGAAPASAATLPLLNEHKIAAQHFGNDAPWYEGNIPFFDSSDPLLNEIYYYRWQLYRSHQRDLGKRGYITTEFLDDVGWQLDPYASLNDATAFHIYEGRWLRNRRYVNDYIDFMYSGGNDRHFSDAIADAVYARFLVDGDLAFAAGHLRAMEKIYAQWNDHYDPTKKLYWIMPLLDATEYTIASIDASGGKDGFWGGEAFRPSINSYMFANARAISRLAELSGDTATASLYAAKADDIRAEVLKSLWSPSLHHFIDRYRVTNQYVHYWEPIRGRELVGYLPWTFGLVPHDPRYDQAWKYLLSPQGLAGPAGLRTVGPRYQYYMRQYRYDAKTGLPECQWNGPVWPFQTTQALTAIQNLLNGYHQSVVTRSDYVRLLRQYAKLHLLNGKPDLQEDYDPATGKPIVGLPRSHHYFHSGFDDLIITGLVGIRPRAGDVLEVNPLVPTDPHDPEFLRYFALQDVPYHGHLVGVVFDSDGTHYGLGAGLFVIVDGAVAASAPTLTRLSVPLVRKAPPPVRRPIDLAMNLRLTGYPHANASINADVPSLYQAVDGRVWFFRNMTNGWSTAGGKGRQWFSLAFGAPALLHSARLAFYADGRNFAAPASYTIQALRSGRWVDVIRRAHTIPNGISRSSWPGLKTRKLRLVFDVPRGKTVRLVELKVF
jgi:hypothetical protein